jgi:hypothetical protein
MVSEYSWETNTWTHTGDTTARPAWRAAVAEIAAKAKQTLPDCAGRVEAAVKLALAGDVELLPEGKAQVASQSNGTTVYHVVNGACTCRDFPKAPSGWCKHRIAAGLYKRAQALVQRQHDAGATAQAEPSTPAAQPAPAPDGPAAALPEAPVSITLKATLHGHEVLVTLRGVDFASVKAQVEAASEWLQGQAPTPSGPAADTTPQCPTHGPMKASTKGTGWYCAHKLPNGAWCPEKRR